MNNIFFYFSHCIQLESLEKSHDIAQNSVFKVTLVGSTLLFFLDLDPKAFFIP